MKSMTMLYFLLIVLFLINTISSYSMHKNRLYDMMHKSRDQKDNKLLVQGEHRYAASSMELLPVGGTQVQERAAWDSGEDRYYKWASLNRRPMESFIGRRRSAEPFVIGAKQGRINGGIWRSGLVG